MITMNVMEGESYATQKAPIRQKKAATQEDND